MPAPVHPPAYRPFRILVYVVFYVPMVYLAGMLLISVTRGVLEEARGPRSADVTGVVAGQPLSPTVKAACAGLLEDLHERLEKEARALPSLGQAKGRPGRRHWQDFSKDFEARVSGVSEDCALDNLADGDEGGEALQRKRDALLELHRVYSTHAARMLAEDGDALKDAARAFAPEE